MLNMCKDYGRIRLDFCEDYARIMLGKFTRYALLTVECPNVTLCYKVKMTFFNTKFNQIRPEIANFWPLFVLYNPQNVLGIVQLITKGKLIVQIAEMRNVQ